MAQAMSEADAVAGVDAEDDSEAVVEQAKPEIDEEMLKHFSLPLFDDDSDSGNEDTNMEGGTDADAGSVESENAGGFRMSIELDEDMLKDFSLPLLDEEEGMEEGTYDREDELSHLSLAGESGTSTRAPVNITFGAPASTGGLATENEGWAMNDDGASHVARSESLPELQALDDGLGAGAMSIYHMPSPTTVLMMGMPLSSPTGAYWSSRGRLPSIMMAMRSIAFLACFSAVQAAVNSCEDLRVQGITASGEHALNTNDDSVVNDDVYFGWAPASTSANNYWACTRLRIIDSEDIRWGAFKGEL
jgi:hypothetical protein